MSEFSVDKSKRELKLASPKVIHKSIHSNTDNFSLGDMPRARNFREFTCLLVRQIQREGLSFPPCPDPSQSL